jgi:hypothetical protein
MALLILLALGCLVGLLVLGTITVQSAYQSKLDVTRTFSGEGIVGTQVVNVTGEDTSETLTGSSTPAVSKDACLSLALSSGAITLDMTAMLDPNLGTVSISGLTPAHVKLRNPSTNANSITIAKGASNGYTGFGASFSVTLAPGSEILLRVGSIVVDGTHKTLDLTGTGSQALSIQITAG